MPWFPVDDGFHSHPKARRAGLEALGLWTVSGSFCMAYLTDGFVPQWFVKERPRGLVLAKRLVQAELWLVGECNGESGWWFHQWKPECLKSHVLDVREKARQRKAKSRESQCRSQGPSRVTDDEQDAGVLGFTQTNPNQPINPLVDSGGGVTQVTPDDPPPKFCPKHMPDGTKRACGGCGKAREAYETWGNTQRDDELARRRQRREIAEDCPICHGTNWVPDTDPAVKCNHLKCNHQAAYNA